MPPKPASGALQIAAATVGNALEWFDILVYAYFAPYIASVFFPNSNPVVSLLLTFGSFGLSYGARPIGAVVLGAYADRSGRKAALALSIRLMVIGTAVMAAHAVLCLHRIDRAHRGLRCAPAAGLRRGRRVRQLDRLYDRAFHPPESLLRQLAVLQSANGETAGCSVRHRAHHHPQRASTERLGMAHPVFLRLVGGTGGHVHPPQSGGDTGVQADHTHPHAGPGDLFDGENIAGTGRRTGRRRHREHLFRHLHADLRHDPSAPAGRLPATSHP